MEQILSTRNPRVKEWAALNQKKYRDQSGRFLIEGIRLVEDALVSAAPVETVLVQDELLLSGKLDGVLNAAYSLDTEIIEVSQAVIEHISDTKTPQGVVAVCGKLQHDAPGLIASRTNPMYLVLDNIQDPGNLGTMIRSADAVNATAVFVGKGSVDLYNPKTVRATMGSLFHLPVMQIHLPELFSLLRRAEVSIVGTDTEAGDDLYGADFTGNLAIVIGSEAHGISGEIRQEISRWITLPMPGKAESLNAAIASSVILYEAFRQRRVQE